MTFVGSTGAVRVFPMPNMYALVIASKIFLCIGDQDVALGLIDGLRANVSINDPFGSFQQILFVPLGTAT